MVEWIEQPALKWALPFPVIAALAPLIWLFFRRTWRELEDEAFVYRRALHERGEIDYRPALALVLGSLVLTFQEYYGRYLLWSEHLRSWLLKLFAGNASMIRTIDTYDELFGRGWWGFTRVFGYLLPLMVWPLFFRKDSLLDMGLRTRGFREHAWLYALFVTVMIPLMVVVARQPDFGSYYPIYDLAGRSWVDFVVWEVIYLAQFLGLEIFFRGWWLRATRIFGIGAIFSMVVPYCMIHYGKPYLEADAAIIAGVVLGSLSMKTRNIWSGFLVHGTVGLLMDILALGRKGKLPTRLSPHSTNHLIFPYWHHVLWAIWVGSLVVLGVTAWRRRQQLRALWAGWRRKA